MNTLPNSAPTPSILTNYLTVLKKFADFKGRARRSEYWQFVLVNMIVSTALSMIDGVLFSGRMGLLSPLYSLAVLVPAVAVCIRRMHDLNKSGWYALIPVYNFILAITEGVKGANEYGPDPKAQAVANVAEPVV